MKTILKRGLSVIITLCIVLSVVIIPSSAASYVANWGQRGVICTSLTSYANNYYTGSYSYATLSSYSGGTSQSNAYSSSLYSELKSMMTNKHNHQTSYNETRDLYKYTDCLNGNTSTISSFYSGKSLNSTWDSGSTWNREHTWPDSKGLNGNDENDIMMLRPTAVSENSSRGNTAYGKSSGYYNPNQESGGTLDLRGDVARICLYVYTRWGNTSYMWGSSGVIESLDVLIEWMTADPVDTWEMGRNDAVQSITGVRNVYVDYPELGFKLFGQSVPEGYSSPSLGQGTGTGGSTGGETGGGTTDTPTEPEADSTLTISEALTLGTSMTHDTTTTNKYYVTGTVAEIPNTTHGNMYITDESGSRIYVYGTFSADGTTRFDGLETKPYVGDTVTLYGVVGNYNGPQMKNAWITNIVPAEGSENEPTTPQEKTVAEVLAMETTPRYDVIVTGEIVETYKDTWETYGNFYIQDSSTNEKLLIYGLWDSTGANRYDALTNKPVVGDTIKVQAPVSFYNNVAQLNNAKLLSLTAGAGGSSGDNTGGNEGGDNTGGNEGGNEGGTETPENPPITPPADTDGIVFEFGANGNAAHVDGTSATTASFTSNGYTLNISGGTQFYKDGFDAKGNSILKLGSSKNIGSFTFTVPTDVVSVVIKAAKYKDYGSVLDVNGTEYTLTKNSNDGEYDLITIDTTTTKNITVATTTSGKRACIDSITYVVAEEEGCEHTYSGDCDAECNDCGNVREVTADHTYTNNCDTICDICEAERTAPHTYSGDCDAECNDCGNVREVTADHTYTDNCDTLCDVCNAERTAPHTYSGDCDAECNDCGDVREVTADHTYTNNCDTLCDVCNAERTAPHTYSGDCDAECNDCGNVRETTADHTYTDDCDAICDVCDAERTAPHNYISDCDKRCNDCGAVRETTAEHTFDDINDTTCNYCGESRGGEDTDIPIDPDLVIRGDANGDGFITIKDITAIKRYLADWDGIAFVPEAADANKDGEVTIKDITYLKRHLAYWDGYDLD